MKKVIIIGGGIGGLALANLLAKKGHDVHVYEKNAQMGGRAGERTTKGFTFDTGPSWYLMPQVFEDYFSLFNIKVNKELAIKRLRPGYKVFFESHDSVTIRGDIAKDSASFEKIEAGAGNALRRYVDEGDYIYQMALKHFLYTDFSRLHQLAKREIIKGSAKLLTLLATPIHSRVKKFVKNPQLQQILEYPMVFLGTSPFKAPAMYSLMSALDFREGVYYPSGGMYSIIRLMVAVGKKHGVTYHTNTEVRKITHTNGQATGIMLKDGKKIGADIVVSNGDLHHTEMKLLSPDAQSYPASFWKTKEAGISALLMYVGVKGSLPQLEHHNLYFVNAWQENFASIYEKKRIPESASMYVSRTTATDPSTAPKGHENLFFLVPLPTDVPLTPAKQAALADHFIGAFATAIHEPDLADRIVLKELFGPSDFKEKYFAWRGTALGMSHLLRQSALWRIPPKSKKLKNLFYVGGNTMPGIGLPMCIISAELAYKKITGNRQPGPLRSMKGEW
jgi:1-hydroxy-2-isopentenylcarotenoid 3,4-desaturase